MSRSDRHALLLALILASLAGYVDALGFLALKGFFVSFMSGNSTRFSIALAGGDRRVAGTAGGLGFDRWALGLAAAGLGAESDVVRKAGPVNLAVTFMTGTLVRMGHGLADMLRGGPRWGWLPYASLWTSLVAGAMAGAVAYPALRLQGLWLPAACCAALAAVTRPGPAR